MNEVAFSWVLPMPRGTSEFADGEKTRMLGLLESEAGGEQWRRRLGLELGIALGLFKRSCRKVAPYDRIFVALILPISAGEEDYTGRADRRGDLA
jgi:hypothetical protein